MLKLPESMRAELAKPHGRLYRGEHVDLKRIEEAKGCRILACVGDLVSLHAVRSSLQPKILIVDGKTLRHERINVSDVFNEYEKIVAENPAGYISCELVKAIKRAVNDAVSGKKVCVWVDGEEDLAVMPLGLFLPYESVILYGQPNQGVVALKIDREKKLLILSLMRRMEKIGECDEIDELLGGGLNGGLR